MRWICVGHEIQAHDLPKREKSYNQIEKGLSINVQDLTSFDIESRTFKRKLISF